jgi:poly(3-hydroxybutyrate) depolymerase
VQLSMNIVRIPFWKRIAALAAAGAFLISCGNESVGGNSTMSIGGRDVTLVSPDGLGSSLAPLIIALHGGLGTADGFRRQLQFDGNPSFQKARVAYLNGTPASRVMRNRLVWNAGDCCGLAAASNINDVGYISSVIANLQSQGLVDGNRVTIVGHSNGAMMAYRFACERPDLVRNVVAISGQLTIPSCSNSSGVRVLQLHGTEDANVPIEGGVGSRSSGVAFMSSAQTAAALQSAGASLQTDFVPGAAHNVDSIQRALQSSGRGGIGTVVANFMGL